MLTVDGSWRMKMNVATDGIVLTVVVVVAVAVD